MEQEFLLPPWVKHPNIPYFSIGWRMGEGESYIIVWQSWAKSMNESQLLIYFAQYKPIPVEWLNWVAYHFGFEDDILSDQEDFPGILWLEEHQLGSYIEFKEWRDKFMCEDQDEDLS